MYYRVDSFVKINIYMYVCNIGFHITDFFNFYFILLVPPNGLVVYCGTIVTDEGKEKKVNIDFEPFKPINTSLYLCDNKFHTEALSELLESDNKFGFIVMDGNGALFGTLSGNTREVIHKFAVELPKKHGNYINYENLLSIFLYYEVSI